jgi:hypothetical protein
MGVGFTLGVGGQVIIQWGKYKMYVPYIYIGVKGQ